MKKEKIELNCLLSIYMMIEQLELSEQKEKTLSLKIK